MVGPVCLFEAIVKPKNINVGKYSKRVFYLLVINILAAHISDFTSSLSVRSRFKNFAKNADYCGF